MDARLYNWRTTFEEKGFWIAQLRQGISPDGISIYIYGPKKVSAIKRVEMVKVDDGRRRACQRRKQ